MKAQLQEQAATEFVVLKSYDGGKRWERERRCPDFSTAADTAQTLRTANPSIRFRVDVEPASPPRRARRPMEKIGSP